MIWTSFGIREKALGLTQVQFNEQARSFILPWKAYRTTSHCTEVVTSTNKMKCIRDIIKKLLKLLQGILCSRSSNDLHQVPYKSNKKNSNNRKRIQN